MRIYLDHNATTPVDPRVLARFVEVESAYGGNPSSVHTTGRQARALVDDAHQTIARALGVGADEVVLVASGTEANNMVVRGLGDLARPVAASVAEHASVLAAARARGLMELPVDRDGATVFDLSSGRLVDHARDGAATSANGERLPPAIVCAVHAQSEVGTLLDLVAARRLADEFGATLHVDASQTFGRVELAHAALVADTLAISLHKAGGLKGVALLIVRQRARSLRPLFLGGDQEHGLRAGTVSPALAAAAALTVQLGVAEWRTRADAMRAAVDAFWQGLRSSVACARITPQARSVPNTLMLAFPEVRDSRMLLPALDLAGVDASHGSACASGSPQPPPVLLAMCGEEIARRCVRFSFAHTTTLDAAQEASARVQQVVLRLARA